MLDIGDNDATSGMTKAIYDQLDAVLRPKVPATYLVAAQQGWKELAFAIATGVINHLVASLEVTVSGLTVTGAVTLQVANNQATGNVTLNQHASTTATVR